MWALLQISRFLGILRQKLRIYKTKILKMYKILFIKIQILQNKEITISLRF